MGRPKGVPRYCELEWCDRPYAYRGLCKAHALRKERGQDLTKPIRLQPTREQMVDRKLNPLCSFPDCDKPNKAVGLCDGHYSQVKRGADLSKLRPKIKSNSAWRIASGGYLVMKIKGKTIFQHRQVMEDFLGRSLEGPENVHHINGVRDDNRLENLELWSSSQPSGQRVPDKIVWAKEILAFYEPEALTTKAKESK